MTKVAAASNGCQLAYFTAKYAKIVFAERLNMYVTSVFGINI